jgi:ATP synthase protein I
MTMSKSDEENGMWATLWREALTALSLGWDLALPIFGGVLAGYWLDRWLGTGHIFTLGLLVLGVAIGYYNVARFIQRLHRQSGQTNHQEEEDKE